MKTIRREALLPFSAAQMFQLVDNIELYPEFLPNCSGTEEIERTQDSVTARLDISKGSFSKSFTTKNKNIEDESIEMTLVEGPFKHLTGQWTFSALNESASKITLEVNFEFKNTLAELAFGGVFNQLAENFVEAFSQRARLVYA